MKRVGVLLILVLAFCGMADSAYLAQHEATGAPLQCNIQAFSGCNVVAQSAYSHLFGIPIADYGILFYTVVFALAALELILFDRALRRALQGFAVIGLLASLVFEAIQAFVIGALCVYCFGSAVITLLIFGIATAIEPMRLRSEESPSGEENNHHSVPVS